MIHRCFSCNKSYSARHGTVFEGSKLMIKQIVQLFHCWWCGDKLRDAALKAQTTQKTACKWYNICRMFCETNAKNSSSRIGGVGLTVEIDETIFGQRKYHRGRKKNSRYIIGGIQHPARRSKKQASRQQQHIFLEIIPDRSARILEDTIVKHVNPRTTIITDCWTGYNRLEHLGYKHKTVNHSMNFVDPRTGASTQRIEGLWSHLREFLPRRGLHNDRLKSYLHEFVYKRNHFGQFRQFLAAITTSTRLFPRKLQEHDPDTDTNDFTSTTRGSDNDFCDEDDENDEMMTV